MTEYNAEFDLTGEEMRIIMLCLRGEYETVEGSADELHDKLVQEGFSAFSDMTSAQLNYKS